MLDHHFPGYEDLPIGYWRFSVAKLNETGKFDGISESCVNRSCFRLELRFEKDRHPEGELLRMVEDLE